jgi:hypothetical protein
MDSQVSLSCNVQQHFTELQNNSVTLPQDHSVWPGASMPISGKLAAALLAIAFALPLAAQQPKPAPEPAQRLVRDVMWNEIHDRDPSCRWQYLSTRTAAGQTSVREQVETSEGPVFRLLERNGAPLTTAEQQREARRIEAYIHDPSAVARIGRDHLQDEARLASILSIIPRAFLFQYEGPPSRDIARLSFRPNPAFVPSGYDARVVHALAGTMTVSLRYKRLIDIRGVISLPVDIGYGLLGSVNPGGTFEIHRCQVSPTQWKTNLVDVHVHGRLLMLKPVSRDEREARSDFRPVPENVTLAQAERLLSQAAALQALRDVTAVAAQQTAAVASTALSSDP